jgi:predicted nicotinamide N-methyase
MAGAFGNFRWSAYTPAGAVERAGFITRQTLRSRRHPEWNEYNRKMRLAGEALLVIPYAAFAVAALIYLTRQILDRL